MSSSSGGATPAALTVTTSVSNLDLTTSWIRCAISAERLDEELKSKGTIKHQVRKLVNNYINWMPIQIKFITKIRKIICFK